MPKKQTTVVTPVKRPAALGAEFVLESLDDAKAAMAELAWCEGRLNGVEGELKELHEAIAAKRTKLIALTIGEAETTLAKRAADLDQALNAWAASHLKEHLTDEAKSIEVPGGVLAVRSLPLSIDPQEGLTDAKVIERIEAKLPFGAKLLKVCSLVFVATTKLLLGELVKVTVALNREKLIAAYKAKRIDDKTLKSLGLVACDDRERFSVKVN